MGPLVQDRKLMEETWSEVIDILAGKVPEVKTLC